MVYTSHYDSPIGALLLAERDGKLVGLWMEGQKYFLGSLREESQERESSPVLRQAGLWLDRYFAGKQPDPDELPLAPAGTPFRQTVWRLLLQIPCGQVMTYGQLAWRTAEALGRPSMSAQAVGSAAGHNPISIIIPCHRLLGADGSLTGYAGGLERKLWLLRHEGADL